MIKNLHEQCDDIADEITKTLDAPPVDIETALGHAVLKGDMSAQDAYDCLGAYNRAFNKTMEL